MFQLLTNFNKLRFDLELTIEFHVNLGWISWTFDNLIQLLSLTALMELPDLPKFVRTITPIYSTHDSNLKGGSFIHFAPKNKISILSDFSLNLTYTHSLEAIEAHHQSFNQLVLRLQIIMISSHWLEMRRRKNKKEEEKKEGVNEPEHTWILLLKPSLSSSPVWCSFLFFISLQCCYQSVIQNASN